ncbi:MAG: hypothetical protein MZU97_05755 [Bacillus subtilis]|nr:hypothetical protein [Bacillus subtilis]
MVESIDFASIKVACGSNRRPNRKMKSKRWIESAIGRDLVFVGASTGSDAHTVGIDAIMNMKGLRRSLRTGTIQTRQSLQSRIPGHQRGIRSKGPRGPCRCLVGIANRHAKRRRTSRT